MTTSERKRMQKALGQIATEHLGIETLTTRKSDSLDFHDVAVWCLKEALEAAYQAGLEAAGKARKGA